MYLLRTYLQQRQPCSGSRNCVEKYIFNIKQCLPQLNTIYIHIFPFLSKMFPGCILYKYGFDNTTSINMLRNTKDLEIRLKARWAIINEYHKMSNWNVFEEHKYDITCRDLSPSIIEFIQQSPYLISKVVIIAKFSQKYEA